MKINKINNTYIFKPSFTSNIDMHVHKGSWWVEVNENQAKNVKNVLKTKDGKSYAFETFDGDIFESANREIQNSADKTEKIIVSNLDCMVRNNPDIQQSSNFPNGIPFLKDEVSGNLELLEKSTNTNEFLYATGQPQYGSADNLRKVIEKNPKKFIGIKLHPEQLILRADDKAYEPYMQLAQEKKLPVLFHSGVDIEWKDGIGTVKQELCPSDPRLIYNLAKKYPDVPLILGHTGAGGEPAHKVAINVFLDSLDKKDAKLYCDISWMDFPYKGLPTSSPLSFLSLIKQAKAKNSIDRILFGSDMPVGIFNTKEAQQLNTTPSNVYKTMIETYKNAIRNDTGLKDDAENIIDCIFYKNAQKLFFEKNIETPPKQKWTKTKIGVAITVGVAILGLAIKAIKDNSTHPKQEHAKVQTYKK